VRSNESRRQVEQQPSRSEVRSMGVLVLMYHGVEQTPGPLFVEPSMFAAHVDAVVASRLPVLTMSEISDLLRQRRLPDRAVALTFDDGFVSVIENAAPLLIHRGLRATVFCVAGRLGGTNQWPTGYPGTPNINLAPASDLSRLAAAGFEIGAHGMDHEPFDTDDAVVIRREVRDARVALEQRIGVPVHSLAYPYGALPTPEARAAVCETYSVACTTRIGRVHAGSDLHALPRVDAHYLRSSPLFRAALEGRANAYLALRRVAASARRRIRRDYSPPTSAR
jgi:peptidoglycan/xylan/chitin deacetylase (PgdA/CDA1 family)